MKILILKNNFAIPLQLDYVRLLPDLNVLRMKIVMVLEIQIIFKEL